MTTPAERLTVGEAASHANVNISTIRRWVKRGLLPAVRTPGGHLRIAADDIDQAFPAAKHGAA